MFIALVQTGQKPEDVLLFIRQSAAGRNIPLDIYPPPSNNPASPFLKRSSHLERKSILVVRLGSHGSRFKS